MLRRSFLAAGLVLALPRPASAQAALTLGQIQPENELERVFLAAYNNAEARGEFRHTLLTSQVALALANSAADSPPRIIEAREDRHVGLIYSSASRLANVLGPAAPFAMLTGRQALTRLSGQHVVLNFRLAPMLTLEPEDVAEYLAS